MPVRHVTLTPNQTATVDAGTGDYGRAGVLHTGNVTDTVWVSASDADPEPESDDTYLIPPGVRRVIPFTRNRRSVKVRSAGAATIEVEF